MINELGLRSEKPQSDVDSNSEEESSLEGYSSAEEESATSDEQVEDAQQHQPKLNTSNIVAAHIKQMSADSQTVRFSLESVILCSITRLTSS